MNQINWDTYKFRCHTLPILMTKSRSASDPLSETAKAKLRELWIKEVYDRENYDSKNKYTEKGIICETESLELIQKVTGKVYFKNKKEFSNDFITGTPDVVSELMDVKNSWSIHTFMNVDEKYALKNYYFQLLGYAWLTDKELGKLVFTLINTPEEIMYEELRRLSYKYPEIDQSEEVMEKFKRNYIFDDIPEEQRIKSFEVKRSDEDIEKIKSQVIVAREYMKGLAL